MVCTIAHYYTYSSPFSKKFKFFDLLGGREKTAYIFKNVCLPPSSLRFSVLPPHPPLMLVVFGRIPPSVAVFRSCLPPDVWSCFFSRGFFFRNLRREGKLTSKIHLNPIGNVRGNRGMGEGTPKIRLNSNIDRNGVGLGRVKI